MIPILDKTQEAMAPSWHDWKIVDWDVKPQHNQPTILDKRLAQPRLICWFQNLSQRLFKYLKNLANY